MGDADEIAREEEELVADRVGKMAHDLLVLGDTDRGQVVVELLKRLERIEAAPTAPSAPGATAPVTVVDKMTRELFALPQHLRMEVFTGLLTRLGFEPERPPASAGWRMGSLIVAVLSAIAGASFYMAQPHHTRHQPSPTPSGAGAPRETARSDTDRAPPGTVTHEPSIDTGFEITSEPPGREVWIDGAPISGARTNFRATRIPAGQHQLELPGDDQFLPWRRAIEIEAGAIVKVHAVLVPAGTTPRAVLRWPGKWPSQESRQSP